MKKCKMRLGDRRDAYRIRDIDSMHYVMPIIFPKRCNNEAFISERIDLTAMNEFLAKKNEDEAFPYTFFHLIVTAVLRTLYQRPKMNRFICNRILYQRKTYSASFVVKKQFHDDGAEGLAYVYGEPGDTLSSIHEDIRRQVQEARTGKGDVSTNAMDIFLKMPDFLAKASLDFVNFLDRRGLAPDFLIGTDCYHASVILSNLGSLKMKSGYHHLSEWGTNSVFVTVGVKKRRPFYEEDGTFTMRDSLDLGLTVDERIADGYYYSKTVKLLKYLLEHPDILEEPLSAPVSMEEDAN